MQVAETVVSICRAAREAARRLALAPSPAKDEALRRAAARIRERVAEIEEANRRDLEGARAAGLSSAMVDRLTLDRGRIEATAQGVETVAALPDPVGETVEQWRRPNGLQIARVRIPIGVIGVIYESRPNVTADAAALCLKAGNACILKGGSEAFHTNTALARIFADAVAEAGLPEQAVQLVPTTDREAVRVLLQQSDLVDVIVPRGGPSLIRAISESSRIPVIQHYAGVCHTYVDEHADLAMAQRICVNAKVQRPGVCNAMETMLVHASIAGRFLPGVCAELQGRGVELRGCERTRAVVKEVRAATEDDWRAEYLDLILAVRVVDSLEEALDHIHRYGTGHSDAIVTDSYTAAQRFLAAVDSAVVYVNASTRFTDGYEFGFGAEVGISTNRLHARGPMGLRELTTYKYLVLGSGQIRE